MLLLFVFLEGPPLTTTSATGPLLNVLPKLTTVLAMSSASVLGRLLVRSRCRHSERYAPNDLNFLSYDSLRRGGFEEGVNDG